MNKRAMTLFWLFVALPVPSSTLCLAWQAEVRPNKQRHAVFPPFVSHLAVTQTKEGSWVFRDTEILRSAKKRTVNSLPLRVLTLFNQSRDEGAYREVVTKGFARVQETVSKYASGEERVDSGETMTLAWATTALFELYNSSQDEQAGLIAKRGFRKLESIQNADGGWGGTSEASDILATAFVLEAFVAAKYAGCDLNDRTRARATAFVRQAKAGNSRSVAASAYSRKVLGICGKSTRDAIYRLETEGPSANDGIYNYFGALCLLDNQQRFPEWYAELTRQVNARLEKHQSKEMQSASISDIFDFLAAMSCTRREVRRQIKASHSVFPLLE